MPARRHARLNRLLSGSLLLLAAFCVSAVAQAEDEAKPDASKSGSLPSWYQDEIDALSRGSGRWQADNAEYRSDKEQFTHYVSEWRKTPDGRGLSGRLYGLTEGKPSEDFWTFRVYWDAAAKGAVIQQFAGYGAIGIGPLVGFGNGTLSDQTFTAPNGRQWRSLHHSWFEGDVHITHSFDWKDGGWQARRIYRWQLQ